MGLGQREKSEKGLLEAVVAYRLALDDKAFELWMLPKQGSPKSMGLLPASGDAVATLISLQGLNLLQENNSLTISLEPKGRSPTGAPPGPLLYQAPMIYF